MNLVSPNVWIYVGNCPICQCGLRRVRVCTGPDASGPIHGYVLCDDCETLWMDTDVATRHTFPEAETPKCPVCQMPLYGPQSRWATENDLVELGWRDRCIVEAASVPPDACDGLSLDDELPNEFGDESAEPRPGC